MTLPGRHAVRPPVAPMGPVPPVPVPDGQRVPAPETDPEIKADEALRRWILDTANRHGGAVIQVAGDESGAPYAFTAGLWRTFGRPEALVIGLPPPVAAAVLGNYVQRVVAGESFRPGALYEKFLEGLQVTFERIASRFHASWMGSLYLLHPQGNFAAMQLLVPLPGPIWPWWEEAPEGFPEYQPVLTAGGEPESWTPGLNGP
jgi:hypothetical protein